MSTRSGDPKKQGQKYQNRFAFKHNKNSMLTRKIRTSPLDFLCKKCFTILEWKITFRKYKPLTTPSKCNTCSLKTIYKAYRTMCDGCAVPGKLCSKCGDKVNEYVKQKKKNIKDRILDLIEALPERYKKTAMRKYNDGEELFFDAAKGIVNHQGDIVVDIINCKDYISELVYDREGADLDDQEDEHKEGSEEKKEGLEEKKEGFEEKKLPKEESKHIKKDNKDIIEESGSEDEFEDEEFEEEELEEVIDTSKPKASKQKK